MTEAYPDASTGGASRDHEGAKAPLGMAEWVCLAATPIFAIMALLTGLGGSRPQVDFFYPDWWPRTRVEITQELKKL